MTDTILFVVGVMVLLGIGVLIGSSLHTASIDQRYRRLAHGVRHINAREAALNSRAHPAAICSRCPLERHRGTLLIERASPVDEE